MIFHPHTCSIFSYASTHICSMKWIIYLIWSYINDIYKTYWNSWANLLKNYLSSSSLNANQPTPINHYFSSVINFLEIQIKSIAILLWLLNKNPSKKASGSLLCNAHKRNNGSRTQSLQIKGRGGGQTSPLKKKEKHTIYPLLQANRAMKNAQLLFS